MINILIVDDEKKISDIIAFNLEKEGYNTIIANNGKKAIEKIKHRRPDLVILDIMMPEINGIDVLKWIRKKYSFPVIILTAKESEDDKVLGLELGADDYVVKPFSMKELIARVNANVRRYKKSIPVKENKILEFGKLKIDLDKYEVLKDDYIVDLTLREYELLKYLAINKDQVFSREKLLKEVWGYDYIGDIRTVDVTVRRLREKIEDEDGEFKYILTKRGVGYYFGGD